MDAIQQLQYYSKRIISLMNRYEDATGTMMQDTQSDLEKACFCAIDERDLIRVKALHNRLVNLVDDVEME